MTNRKKPIKNIVEKYYFTGLSFNIQNGFLIASQKNIITTSHLLLANRYPGVSVCVHISIPFNLRIVSLLPASVTKRLPMRPCDPEDRFQSFFSHLFHLDTHNSLI